MAEIFGLSKRNKKNESESDSHERHKNSMKMDSCNTSPFIAGMDEYMERYGNLTKAAARWRQISLILALLCALCVISVVSMSSSVKSVPFIVQVDRHGYEIAVNPVEPSGVDDRLIISRVGRFINNLRTVLNDDTAQVVYIDFVYKSTPSGSAANKKLMDFYTKNNPLTIASTEKVTILVELKSILPLGDSGKTWRGEWEEKRINDGVVISTKSYTGIFEIQVTPPSTMKDIIDNPLGIFITDFNITEELKK